MTEKRRAVVTGMGMISALGVGLEATWQRLLAGESGAGPITSFDASGLPTQIAAEVKGFEAECFISDRKILRVLTRGEAFALASTQKALDMAGIAPKQLDAARGGIYIGCGKDVGPLRRLY